MGGPAADEDALAARAQGPQRRAEVADVGALADARPRAERLDELVQQARVPLVHALKGPGAHLHLLGDTLKDLVVVDRPPQAGAQGAGDGGAARPNLAAEGDREAGPGRRLLLFPGR